MIAVNHGDRVCSRIPDSLRAYCVTLEQMRGRQQRHQCVSIALGKLSGVNFSGLRQAWEVREDEITRVRTLQRERSQQERLLREELNEVLDDAGESAEEQK